MKIYGVDELTQHYLELTKEGGVAGDIKEGFIERIKKLGYGMVEEAMA